MLFSKMAIFEHAFIPCGFVKNGYLVLDDCDWKYGGNEIMKIGCGHRSHAWLAKEEIINIFAEAGKKRRDMESAAVNFTIGEDPLGLST